MEQNVNCEEMQNARALLRERYLRTMTSLIGINCIIRMHDNTTVDGTFRGCDAVGAAMIVTDLSTPFMLMPQTIIRMNDVIHLSFMNIDLEQDSLSRFQDIKDSEMKTSDLELRTDA